MNPTWLAALALAAVSACTAGPEPIRWGTDTCEQCRMVLEDKRFGALLEAGGRTYKFDGLDELAKYMASHPGGTPYAVDATSGQLVEATRAVLVSSPELRGPMGGQVVAFADAGAAERFVAAAHLKAVRHPRVEEVLYARP
jgi:copper chaperone NosL